MSSSGWNSTYWISAAILALFNATTCYAFTFLTPQTSTHAVVRTQPRRSTVGSNLVLQAGGFEYQEDEDQYDSIENPYKKESSFDTDGSLKVDAARLLGPRLKGSSVYLVGMMGSGKSSVGNVLAKRMGTYSFLDTDGIIENVTGMTIPAIFEAEGEEGFRSVEGQVLDSVHAYVRCVVSTGGGIVCRPMVSCFLYRRRGEELDYSLSPFSLYLYCCRTGPNFRLVS